MRKEIRRLLVMCALWFGLFVLIYWLMLRTEP